MMMNLNKSYKQISKLNCIFGARCIWKRYASDIGSTFTADTLFSALFQQAIHSIGVISADQLLDDAKERSFVMSDALYFWR